MDEMDKGNVIYTHTQKHTHRGILFSHKKKEILPFATTWVNLEDITLSEISQTKTNLPRNGGRYLSLSLFVSGELPSSERRRSGGYGET